MAKINRTIKFLIIIGIIVFIDTIIDMTYIFNKSVQTMILMIFGLKTDDNQTYTSLYASIAVLMSSRLDIIKKFDYSASLIILYAWIFTFINAYRIIYPFPYYPFLNLILTLIAFITMTFPILLWIMLDGEISENSKKVERRKQNKLDRKQNKLGRKQNKSDRKQNKSDRKQNKSDRKNKSV